MIVYCGLNCMECPAYIATQKDDREELEKIAKKWSNEKMSFAAEDIYCDGCNSEERIFVWCKDCDIRNCCIQKGFENCAYCDDYVCDKLKNTFDADSSTRKNLEEIRKAIKK